MADIAASDVVYTLQDGTQKTDSEGAYSAVFKVVFGNGVLTYPSGGVPLTKGSLGCPAEVLELHLMDSSAALGLIVKYDYANLKIRMFEGNYADTGDGVFLELDAGSDAPAAATLYVKVVGY